MIATAVETIKSALNQVNPSDLKMPLHQPTVRYWETNSMNGLIQIRQGIETWRKMFWTLLWVLGSIATILTVFETCSEYYAYPVITTMKVENRAKADFPTVTICNLNRVHCESLVVEIQTQSSMTPIGERLCQMYLMANCMETAIVQLTHSEDFVPDLCQAMVEPWQTAQANVTLAENNNHFSDLLLALPLMTRLRIGYGTFEDQVLSCHLNGQKCDPLSVQPMNLYSYGTCFVFNFNQTITMDKPGPDFGMTVDLLAETPSYLKGGLSPSEGFRVTITKQNSPVLPINEGFFVRPGSEMSIALTQSMIARMPKPYPSDCRSQWIEDPGTIQRDNLTQDDLDFLFFNRLRYSQSACQRICLFKMSYSVCGCYMSLWNDRGGFQLPLGASFCSRSNDTQLKCVDESLKQNELADICGHCRPSCSHVRYNTEITSAVFPSSRFWLPYIQERMPNWFTVFQNHLGTATTKSQREEFQREWQAEVQSQLVRLHIYFKNFETVSIYEEPKMPIRQFINNLGGSLSLWLGISFVTMLELVEWLADLMFASIVGAKKK